MGLALCLQVICQSSSSPCPPSSLAPSSAPCSLGTPVRSGPLFLLRNHSCSMGYISFQTDGGICSIRNVRFGVVLFVRMCFVLRSSCIISVPVESLALMRCAGGVLTLSCPLSILSCMGIAFPRFDRCEIFANRLSIIVVEMNGLF